MENIHVDLHPRKKMQYTYVVRYCILSLTIKDFLVKYFAKKKSTLQFISRSYIPKVHSMCTCTFKYILCVHVHSSTFCVTILAVDNTCFFM